MRTYKKPEIEIIRFEESILTGVGSDVSVGEQEGEFEEDGE